MKYLKIHDLLRDVCMREAQKERFYHVVGQHSTQGMYIKKRVFVPRCTSMEKVLHAMKWTLRAYDAELPNLGQNGRNYWRWEIHELLRNLCLREAEKERFHDVVGQHSPRGMCSQHHVVTLGSTSNGRYLDAMEWTLRACGDDFYLGNIFELDNLRLLVIYSKGHMHNQLPSSVNLFWSLHTLVVYQHYNMDVHAPVEIWNMPQLRHVHFNGFSWGGDYRGALCLPNPPSDSSVIMENLQTLKGVKNFKCDEMMVRRVPNIKKLGLIFDQDGVIESLDNIDRLQKLESLSCTLKIFIPGKGYFCFRKLTFPHSLKKVTLDMCNGKMEEILEKLSTLPFLQRLKLFNGRFGTHKWETVEGQFQSLKILSLAHCSDLEYWAMESSHFPSLEHLHLRSTDLNEIPAELGEIPTLKSVALEYCSASAVKSARRMIEEQEDLQGDELSFKVVVRLREMNEELHGLANPNFQVTVRRN
ncbi:late blight resistance protein R1-A-like [Salvia hispanica]|uniref:late blight resistance protein R1-A-like n=1 Tax=Salvia hispanica TaxID=49212 RepID=UPI002009C6AD|nr:late blight resistance protein R1-A-like [Salvia hispanica]